MQPTRYKTDKNDQPTFEEIADEKDRAALRKSHLQNHHYFKMLTQSQLDLRGNNDSCAKVEK